MFLGSFEPKLIGTGRLTLPKKIRGELKGDRVVLTIGFEECVFGFNEKTWEEIVKPELSRPLFSDREGRDLRRKMCMEATVVKLRAQGRFVLPQRMIKYAGIEKNLILIGAGDHFEIWEKTRWHAYLGQINQKGRD